MLLNILGARTQPSSYTSATNW